MSITQTLAEEVVATAYDSVPEAARLQVRRLIADQVGVAFLGARLTGAAYEGYARALGGTPDAVLMGSGVRVPAELAAGVNAQVCRNTDYEETGPGLHAGPVVAMTALAVGERVGASGRDVVAAAALGYELNARFFFARRDGDIRHLGVTAAAIAARLLGLDASATNRALGLAWELPSKSVVYQVPKTPKRVSRLGMANVVSARQGVQAAMLVQQGFDALPDELDTLADQYDIAALTHSPAPYQHTATQLMLKPWPASRLCHGAIQLGQRMMAEHALKPAQIERVVLGLAGIYLMPHQNDPAPEDYWQAIYSVQWNLAMALLGVPPGPAWSDAARLRDPAARALAARIELTEDPEATRVMRSLRWLDLPNSIELHAAGRVFRDRILFHDVLGSPDAPMPPAMFDGKFLGLVTPALGAGRAAQLLAALHAIDEAEDIRTITQLMVE